MAVAMVQEAESDEGFEPAAASMALHDARRRCRGGCRGFRRCRRKCLNRRRGKGLGRTLMRHFLGLADPIVSLAAGMLAGALRRALVTRPGDAQGFRPSQWRTGQAIAIAPIAKRTDVNLLTAPLADKKATRRLTHPASTAMRDWTATAGPAMLRRSPVVHPALTTRPGRTCKFDRASAHFSGWRQSCACSARASVSPIPASKKPAPGRHSPR
jgi:hypothetical protein